MHPFDDLAMIKIVLIGDVGIADPAGIADGFTVPGMVTNKTGRFPAHQSWMINLKKSVEFNHAENIQHKLDNPIGAMGNI